jgi:hypothetical protein
MGIYGSNGRRLAPQGAVVRKCPRVKHSLFLLSEIIVVQPIPTGPSFNRSWISFLTLASQASSSASVRIVADGSDT